MKKGVIRVEANSDVGLGHATRAFSLCEMLSNDSSISLAFREMPSKLKKEFGLLSCDLICLKDINPSEEYSYLKSVLGDIDFVIVDGYSFLDYFKLDVKSSGVKLILIDDNTEISIKADLLINHSPGLRKTNYPLYKESNLCLGLDFALLRSDFLKDNFYSDEVNDNLKKDGVLVCLGGSDPLKISNLIVKALLSKTKEVIHCVLGELNSNFNNFDMNQFIDNRLFLYQGLSALEMRKLMLSANVGVCSSSTISLECIASRLPILVGWSVDNQKNIYDGITNKDLAIGLGNFDNIQEEQIVDSVMSLVADEKSRNRMIDSQISHLDLRSSTRIKKAILEN